jgi:hypothetical protein
MADTLGDSTQVSGTSAATTFRFVVPGCTGRVDATAFAVDTAGNRTEGHDFLIVVLPISTFEAALSDTVYSLGDSARVTVTATNPHGLGWVGVRWSTLALVRAESVAVSGTSATHTFAVQVPPNEQRFELVASVFARHTLGYRSSVALPAARTTDAQRMPMQTLELPGVPTDAVWSPRRDRVYLTMRQVAAVRELTLAPLALGAAFSLAGYGTSLDLTESEDSLVVARSDTLALGVVPLTGGAGSTVFLAPPETLSMNIYDTRRVRVVGGARAMVGAGSGSSGWLMEVNLASLAQRRRVPWYGYGTFERAARARLLVVDGTSPVGSQLYLAATDTFLPPESGRLHGYQPTADTVGSAWLVGSELFTPDLAFLRGMQGEISWESCTLAVDGARVYCPRFDGMTEYDAATGAPMRAVLLPRAPLRLLALGARRVLAVRDSAAYLVSLPE